MSRKTLGRGSQANSSARSVTTGAEFEPVETAFHHALCYANWLHDQQPFGAQGNSTTQNGAYTLTPSGEATNTIARNPVAIALLPSEDEWYKAPYYDPSNASFFGYPTGSDAPPICASPDSGQNSANCAFAVGEFISVGSNPHLPVPYATFDQGGNVAEWTDTVPLSQPTTRVVRGGDYDSLATSLAASVRGTGDPTASLGFRVARPLPEPGVLMALAAGGILLHVLKRRRSRQDRDAASHREIRST